MDVFAVGEPTNNNLFDQSSSGKLERVVWWRMHRLRLSTVEERAHEAANGGSRSDRLLGRWESSFGVMATGIPVEWDGG